MVVCPSTGQWDVSRGILRPLEALSWSEDQAEPAVPFLPPCPWPERERGTQGGPPLRGPQRGAPRPWVQKPRQRLLPWEKHCHLRKINLCKCEALLVVGFLLFARESIPSWHWSCCLPSTVKTAFLSSTMDPISSFSEAPLLTAPRSLQYLQPFSLLYFPSSLFHTLISAVLDKTFMFKQTVPHPGIFPSCFCLIFVPPFTNILLKRAVYIHSPNSLSPIPQLTVSGFALATTESAFAKVTSYILPKNPMGSFFCF